MNRLLIYIFACSKENRTNITKTSVLSTLADIAASLICSYYPVA